MACFSKKCSTCPGASAQHFTRWCRKASGAFRLSQVAGLLGASASPSLLPSGASSSTVIGSLVLQAPAHWNKKLIPFLFMRVQTTIFSGNSELQHFYQRFCSMLLQGLNQVLVRMKLLFRFQIPLNYERGLLPYPLPALTQPPRTPVKVGGPPLLSPMRRELRWTLLSPLYTQTTVTPKPGHARFLTTSEGRPSCVQNPTVKAGGLTEALDFHTIANNL